jgi:hypothetical protein
MDELDMVVIFYSDNFKHLDSTTYYIRNFTNSQIREPDGSTLLPLKPVT